MKESFREIRRDLVNLWEDKSLDITKLEPLLSKISQYEKDCESYQMRFDHFREILNRSPNPLFEEDFSKAEEIVNGFRDQGIPDIREYLLSHPEVVKQIAQSVRIISINHAAAAIYGIEELDDFFPTLDPIVAAESYGDFIEQFMAIIEGSDYFEQEMQNRNEIGDIDYLILALSVINREVYGVSRVIITISDISQMKRIERQKAILEERLHQSEKMESLGRLAGGVAHDLNNVLVGVVSYPDLLLYDMDDDDPMKGPLSLIRDSGQDATNIAQDLLTLSRRSAMVMERIDCNRLIRDLAGSAEMMHHLEQSPHVRLETDLADPICEIAGSPSHIRKMLLNLLLNAFDAQIEPGTIRVRTQMQEVLIPPVALPDLKPSDYLLISISDEGVGLSEEDLKMIYEPFYSKKTLGRSGSGIGMTVVLGVVTDHQGYIDVTSGLGEGTTFTIYLPVECVRDSASDMQESGSLIGNGEKVLVVDDMDMQRTITMKTISKLNYTTSGAASGLEAVSLLESGYRPDIVVLDMIMPDHDGFDTYAMLKEIVPDIRTILLSGYAESDRVRRAMELGVSGFIRKPYTMEQLGLALRQHLGR